MKKLESIMTIVLAMGLLCGCSVKMASEDPSPKAKEEPQQPQQQQLPTATRISKIFEGGGYPPLEYTTYASVSDMSKAETVFWYDLSLSAAKRLQVYGLQISTVAIDGAAKECDTNGVEVSKSWVSFDSNSVAASEFPIDDSVYGIFYVDPAKTSFLKLVVKGDFSGCLGVEVGFIVQVPAAEIQVVQPQVGYFKTKGKNLQATPPIRVEGVYPILKFSSGAEVMDMICYNSRCGGLDSKKQFWVVSLGSPTTFDVRQLGTSSPVSMSYFFSHGLVPRPIDPNNPFLPNLAGRWIGTMDVIESNKVIETREVEISVTSQYGKICTDTWSCSTWEMGTRLGIEFTEGGLNDARAYIYDNRHITALCVGAFRPIGNYMGGNQLQFAELNNNCNVVANYAVSLAIANDGSLTLSRAMGARTYKANLTAW